MECRTTDGRTTNNGEWFNNLEFKNRIKKIIIINRLNNKHHINLKCCFQKIDAIEINCLWVRKLKKTNKQDKTKQQQKKQTKTSKAKTQKNKTVVFGDPAGNDLI